MKIKREMTALDILCVIEELKSKILDAYIDNIYQISPNIFIFKLRKSGQTFNLLFEVGRRIHLTNFIYEKPKLPPPFCKFLRKNFNNRKIVSISQHDFDRIIYLKASNELSLIFELVREGNLIVIDEQLEIKAVLKPKEMKDRTLIKGEKYTPPPIRGINPLNVSQEKILKLFSSKERLIQILVKKMNLPGELAEEICTRCDINKNVKANMLEPNDILQLINALREIINLIHECNLQPQIIYDNEHPLSVVPVNFQIYKDFRSEHYNSFNEALDIYFNKLFEYERKELEIKIKRNIEAKYKAILKKQIDHLNELKNKAEKYRRWADIIMENLINIQKIIDKINDLIMSKISPNNLIEKLKAVLKNDLCKHIVNYDAKNKVLYLKYNGELIPINIRLSAAKNASKFYDKAKDLNKRSKRAEEAIKEIERKMNIELEKELSKAIVQSVRIVGKIKKKKWYENFLWFISSDNFLVIGGRDASQNEALVRKWLKNNDIFIHADIHGGPAVIIKCEGKEVPHQTLFEASQLAVSYSRAWSIGLEATSAYWVKGSQVSKSPPTGEYLAKGAFMIYGKKNYIHDIPLRIAIGIKQINGQLKLIYGPPNAIKKHTDKYIILAPGYISREKIILKIKEKLMKMASELERSFIRKISNEDLVRMLPKGKFRVIDS